MSPAFSLIGLLLSPIASWDLENEDGGFLSEGDTAQWEWGAVESGPHSSHDGSNAWATILDGDYLNDSVDTLQLPPLDLGGLERPVLGFIHWVEIDEEGDLGTVEVEQSGTWISISPVYGYPTEAGFTGSGGAWESVYFDLSGLADLSQVRLRFSADEAVARSGWVVDDFNLWDGDPIPPLISDVTELVDTQDLEAGQAVEASIIDDQSVVSASVLWESDEGQSGSVEMAEIETDIWSAELPVFEPDTTVSWSIVATDGETDGSAGPWSYRTYLAAPGGLSGPDERTVAAEVELTWEAPECEYPVLAYRIYRSGVLDTETESAAATLETGAVDDEFTVSALYETPMGDREGDLSDGLFLHLYLPQVLEIRPAFAWPGDLLYLEILGDYLLFSQDDASVDLGGDIELLDVDVQDVDLARFLLQITPDASPGVRDLVVQSGELSLVESSAFTVLSDSDRPRLLSVTPDALEQGEDTTVCIELNTPLEGDDLQVDLGEGVYVESLWTEAEIVWVDLVVDPAAPIGLHDVVVDDGIRIREGASLRIRDRREPVQTVCASRPYETEWGGAWLPTLCMLMLGLRRMMAPGREFS